MIPYGRQSISEDDVRAVVDVLRSDFLTQGPQVPAFEEAVAAYAGAAHAVAVNSATSALHLACMALDLGPGDLLWTSPITFVASANCARYCGADVDFVDIDPDTLNLSVAALEEKLARAAREGRLPRVIVPVHFAGRPCDMPHIAELASQYGCRVIEDASHAIGARLGADPVGSCTHSDITVFSFHPVKIVTSAEGGMALTNDPALAGRLSMLRTHGITREPARLEHNAGEGWYYEQHELGYNYRMTDLHAALGRSQLGRIDPFIDARHEVAARYDEKLRDLPLKLPAHCTEGRSALHLYPVQFADEAGRRRAYEYLRQRDVGVNVHYIPVPAQPYYRRLGFRPEDFPQALAYYHRALSLPIFPDLNTAQQDRVIDDLYTLLGS